MRAAELERVLQELERITGCKSVAVAGRDGLLIVHRMASGVDPASVSAVAATAVDAATAAARSLEQGEFEQLVIKCAEGTVFAAEAGPDAVLIALYDRDADLSFSRLRLRRATQVIEEALGRPGS